MAQSEDNITNRLFGKSINGVQMSITLKTNVVNSGSSVGVYAEIKNSSTNTVYIGETAPANEFLVLLIDGAGRKLELTNVHPQILFRNLRSQLAAGANRDWIIPISIGKNISAGEYSLKAKRKFSEAGRTFEAESNILKIRIQ